MSEAKVTVSVEIDGKVIVAALAALPDPDGEEGYGRVKVGDVGYLDTDDFPVLVEAVGVIVHDSGWIERVVSVSYLTNAWGWITNRNPDHGDEVALRVEYNVGTGTTESASNLSPEPHDVMMARWARDRNVGVYPPYQTEAEWRAQPYGEPLLPAHMERIEDDPKAAQEAGF